MMVSKRVKCMLISMFSDNSFLKPLYFYNGAPLVGRANFRELCHLKNHVLGATTIEA